MNLLSWMPDPWKDLLRTRAGAVTLRARLANLRRAGFNPRRIIDAGAFTGQWALIARSVFPSADILLIEPQPDKRAALEELCARTPGFAFAPALLGASPGRARFLLEATNSRIVSPDYQPPPGANLIELPVVRLDEFAASHGFPSCDLLKLDLQGHELSALAGAGAIFGGAEIIVTEVSWLAIGDGPLISDVISACQDRGYRLYDIFGFNYRPLDGALWQTDLVFVRGDSPLLADHRWA